jgi:penicillin-insensitive murein endopeptidase
MANPAIVSAIPLAMAVSVFGLLAGDPLSASAASGEQAVGAYDRGTLVHGVNLPLEGDGFVKLFHDRDRGWSTSDLQDEVREVASRMAHQYPGLDRMQIGDFARKGGGDIDGHASHENGLDVDIAYFRNDHSEHLRESSFEEKFVSDGAVTQNFDVTRNWESIKSFVHSGRVNRIFVDGAIKARLCRQAQSQGELSREEAALRVLRPLENHQDHYHVRLLCPADSPRCKAQEPTPSGSGCGKVAAQQLGRARRMSAQELSEMVGLLPLLPFEGEDPIEPSSAEF